MDDVTHVLACGGYTALHIRNLPKLVKVSFGYKALGAWTDSAVAHCGNKDSMASNQHPELREY